VVRVKRRVLAHQPADLLGIHDKAAVAEFGADAAVAVELELISDRADFSDELRVGRLLRGPGVEGGAG